MSIDKGKGRKEELDIIVDNLFYMLPFIHRAIKKKLHTNNAVFSQHGLLPHHYEILRVLRRSGRLHISSVADRLFISRPQMTYLVDKLVSMDMVERTADPEDRRMLDIQLTNKGKSMIEEHRRRTRDALRESMTQLTDEELNEVSVSLQKIREVFSRL